MCPRILRQQLGQELRLAGRVTARSLRTCCLSVRCVVLCLAERSCTALERLCARLWCCGVCCCGDQVGMVCSNEPGYYEDGGFGIRIENLLTIEEAGTEFRCVWHGPQKLAALVAACGTQHLVDTGTSAWHSLRRMVCCPLRGMQSLSLDSLPRLSTRFGAWSADGLRGMQSLSLSSLPRLSAQRHAHSLHTPTMHRHTVCVVIWHAGLVAPRSCASRT